jgi:hypothetical protein
MNNTQRSLKGVVSVDGWIAKFDKNNSATVHVDIVFRQGHFGADDKEKIRFRVCLSRAEVILRIADGEPLHMVKQSIARTPLPDAGTRETVRRTSRKASASAKASASLVNVPAVSVAADLAASGQVDITDKAKQKLSRYLSQHFQTTEGHPAWEITHSDEGSHLEGAPWDARTEHRLKVRRDTERNADGDKPSIKVEVRCLREDIVIEDLSAKDDGTQRGWLSRPNSDVNLAAAEQVIKDELFKAGFMRVGNLHEKYTVVLIADAILTEDW